MTEGKASSGSGGRKTFPLVAAVAYVATYFAALWSGGTDVAGPVKVGLSVLAIAAFGLLLVAEFRLVRSLDELQQRIQLEALALAFPLSIALVMFLGLLQRLGDLPVEDASVRHIWPVMIIFYAAGLALARRRYR